MENRAVPLIKQKIKIIIAREGLIIISLLLLAGASAYVDLWLNNQKEVYESTVQEIELVIEEKEEQEGRFLTTQPTLRSGFIPLKQKKDEGQYIPLEEEKGRFLTPLGIILQFPKGTSKDVIKQTIKRDFPNIQGNNWIVFDSPKGKNISAFYDEKGSRKFDNIIYKIDFSDVSIFFLFFAYPLYLLIRFIIWAIGTLKVSLS